MVFAQISPFKSNKSGLHGHTVCFPAWLSVHLIIDFQRDEPFVEANVHQCSLVFQCANHKLRDTDIAYGKKSASWLTRCCVHLILEFMYLMCSIRIGYFHSSWWVMCKGGQPGQYKRVIAVSHNLAGMSALFFLFYPNWKIHIPASSAVIDPFMSTNWNLHGALASRSIHDLKKKYSKCSYPNKSGNSTFLQTPQNSIFWDAVVCSHL